MHRKICHTPVDHESWLSKLHFKEGRVISKSGYGFVTTLLEDSVESTTKVMKNIFALFDEDDFPKICEEFQIARSLADASIGPTVYHSVLFTNGPDKFARFGGLLIMQKLDMTLKEYLISCVAPSVSWKKRLFELIRMMSKQNIFCVDMKPQNVMLNVSNCECTAMKLIDFGDFCNDEDLRGLLHDLKLKTKQIAMRALMLVIMDSNIFRICQFRAFEAKVAKYSRDPEVARFLEAAMQDGNVGEVMYTH